jgi:GLPGLI family protein
MKKRLLTLTTALLACFAAKAQKPEIAKEVVHYKFSHIRDTAAKDKPYTENMVLFLGQTSSAYKSFDKRTQDALMKKQLADQAAEQKGSGTMNFKITGTRPTTRAVYYQFPSVNKLIRKETLITPYLIEEPMPVINWKISTDTASFGQLHCQKATGHFKGRDYTAWFCPDLPFHAGPWKLNGLPGLIVEAYDTNKEVVFKFDGMEEVSAAPSDKTTVNNDLAANMPGALITKLNGDDSNQDPNLIALPEDAVKTTDKEFNNLQAAMRKDPKAFSEAMRNASGMRGITPGAPTGGGGVNTIQVNVAPGAGPVINNPLELPEKK